MNTYQYSEILNRSIWNKLGQRLNPPARIRQYARLEVIWAVISPWTVYFLLRRFIFRVRPGFYFFFILAFPIQICHRITGSSQFEFCSTLLCNSLFPLVQLAAETSAAADKQATDASEAASVAATAAIPGFRTVLSTCSDFH